MLSPDEARTVVDALIAMEEAEEAIFEGRADQYHSDTLHDAARKLREVFGITRAAPARE